MAQSQVRFNFMYGSGVVKTGQDLSNTKEPIYKELPPYAVDDKGNFLNKSSFPKLEKVGEIDVQEQIDSYADEVNIYKILERFALSGGDNTIINRSVGSFGDFVEIPDNLHDFDMYVGSKIDDIKKYDPDLAKVILSEASTEADIKAAIDKYVLGKVNAPKAATLDDVKAAIEGLNKNVEKKDGDK